VSGSIGRFFGRLSGQMRGSRMAGFHDMPEHDSAPEEPRQPELAAVLETLETQRQLIAELRETVTRQAALIDELLEDLRGDRGRKPKGRTRHTGATYDGLGVRTEAILRLAQAEALDLREEARRAAAAQIAAAEREAARIRAEAAGSRDIEA
jgi:hypothetical protein